MIRIMVFLLMYMINSTAFSLGTASFPDTGRADSAGEITEYLGLECVEAGTDSDSIMRLYQEKREEWEAEGCVPLIVVDDDLDVMDQQLAWLTGQYGSMENYTRKILSIYQEIDTNRFFEDNREMYDLWMEWEKENGQDADMSWDYEESSQDELYVPGYYERYLILKVPVTEPYEALAYVPFGGYNACPPLEDHVAVAKKWYEEYGAVPCAVGYDTLQYYVENPVTDEEQLKKLAVEMMIYCDDIVYQGTESMKGLEKSIDGSRFWFFWWD